MYKWKNNGFLFEINTSQVIDFHSKTNQSLTRQSDYTVTSHCYLVPGGVSTGQ